jgi:hypothetical protein
LQPKCAASPKARKHVRNNPECKLHVNEDELPAADEVATLRTECQELVECSAGTTQENIWVNIF